MALITQKIKLLDAQFITPNVKHFKFATLSETPFKFVPGQFITLHLPIDQKILKRSYSIASIPGKDDTIDFAASYVQGGLASEYLFNIQPGEIIEIIGPVGRLVLREEAVTRYVLIATGTGVTPYRAMLPQLEHKITSQKIKVMIMQGVKTADNLLYGKDFLAAMERHPDCLTFGAYYSVGAGEAKHEHHGRVSQHLESLNLNPQGDIVYLCGNPNMIDEVYEKLKTLGFDPNHVRREKYFSS